jgi:Na+-transporting NADH:ubiquinone oxidoreductase subunit NqrC
MNFSDVMQNLAIGIVGGIFSSIIVSVVFYVLSEYQKEINTAKKMTNNLRGIVVQEKIKNDYHSKYFDRYELAERYFKKSVDDFEKFDPKIFKYEIRKAMCNIYYEMLTDGKYYNCKWDDKLISDTSALVEKNLDIIENCEKNFAKGFLKRVFTNRVVIVAGLIFLLIILEA